MMNNQEPNIVNTWVYHASELNIDQLVAWKLLPMPPAWPPTLGFPASTIWHRRLVRAEDGTMIGLIAVTDDITPDLVSIISPVVFEDPNNLLAEILAPEYPEQLNQKQAKDGDGSGARFPA